MTYGFNLEYTIFFPTNQSNTTFGKVMDDRKETGCAVQSFLFPQTGLYNISGPTETKQLSPQSTEQPKGYNQPSILNVQSIESNANKPALLMTQAQRPDRTLHKTKWPPQSKQQLTRLK